MPWTSKSNSKIYHDARATILSSISHKIKVHLSRTVKGEISVTYTDYNDDITITITVPDNTQNIYIRDALSAIRNGVTASQLSYKARLAYQQKILQKYFKNIT